MDNEKMGAFVAELRKEKGMTQRELAAKLNITDKAVSKWERGLSLPDIALLTPLAQELGISVGELLDGEKEKSDRNDVANTLDYADKAMKNKVRSFRSIAAAVFSVGLLLDIIVCAICDMAVSNGFTFSLFTFSSSVFAWAVLFPVIKLEAKGVAVSLGAVTVLIVPFLAVLDMLTGGGIMNVGVPAAVISVIYLWCAFALFKIMKSRKLMAAAIALLLLIPVSLVINLIIAQMLAQPFLDMWDWLAFGIIAVGAAVFFAVDLKRRRKYHDKDIAGRG